MPAASPHEGPLTISVIVPTWMRPAALGSCLDGLEAQSRAPDEVVVVARADDHATAAALDSRAHSRQPVIVVAPRSPGMVAAINTGLDRASGDILCLTDDDAVPRRDWLARVESHICNDSTVGAVGGRDWIWHDGRPENGSAVVVGRVLRFGRVVGNHHLGSGPPRRVEILKGVNMSFRATALAGRRMDTAMLGEATEQHCDLDLSLAVGASGWDVVYDPAVEVDHYEAPRPGGQRETVMTSRQLRDASHNVTYALMKGLPRSRATVAVLYSLLVGTRHSPGLLLAAEGALRDGDPRGSMERLAAASRGRLLAFRTYWRRRRARAQRTDNRRCTTGSRP